MQKPIPAPLRLRGFLKDSDKGSLRETKILKSHYCVYFAAYDPDEKQVFIGHHIKSGLWLVNGGHIDKNEAPKEAMEREMEEEWGFVYSTENLEPQLLTVTEIVNPKQTCKRHYNIWYFLPVAKPSFHPDKRLLAKEFYKTGWFDLNQAKRLVTETNTLKALGKLEELTTG